MSTLYQYLQAVNRVWEASDGNALARSLSLSDYHTSNRNLQVESPETAVDRQLDSPIDEIVSSHLKVLYYLTAERESHN
jgi:nuclear mRNA export protein PCID2/THP1